MKIIKPGLDRLSDVTISGLSDLPLSTLHVCIEGAYGTVKLSSKDAYSLMKVLEEAFKNGTLEWPDGEE